MISMFRALVLTALLAGTADAALAQNWPTRPIKFIVSQSPGNATDIIARVTADSLSARLGQPVVVENRPGGGNVIGTQAAARSAPDGYTFFFATAAALVTDPYTFKSLPYDPMKDFVPVSKIAEVAFMVMANPSVPAKTLDELIALAKKQPGKLTIATDGTRRFSGMIVAWLNKLAGMNIQQVPYTAQTRGVQDAIGGIVNFVIVAAPVARSHQQSGKLKAIAITSLKRMPQYPDVPAVAEKFPGFDFTGWFVLVAPTGTPAGVLERMNREINAVLKSPGVESKLRSMQFAVQGGSLKEARDYVNLQHATWGKVVKEIGVTPQ
ncbi:MAG: Bug family tripartite tricarboxylate transporter substrate binding protein [Xanthobacteraceae bacterium]